MAGELFGNLHPFITPDYELIHEFKASLIDKDADYLNKLVALSRSIWDARTAQAMNGRSLFSSSQLPTLMKRTSKVLPIMDGKELELIESALAQNIKINIPINGDVSEYFKHIDPYRIELAGIVDSIVSESSNQPDMHLIKLNKSLSGINEQLNSLSRNKKYLTYKAVIGFAKSNQLLLSSIFVASIFGLVPGCGVLTASVVGKIAKKYGKLEIPVDAIPLISELKHSIRPHLNHLLSHYTNIDIRAIQLFEIGKSIEKDRRQI